MIQTINYRGTKMKSEDELLLGAYLQQLVGLPFLQFRFSYGDELSLHLGKPTKYESPKLRHLRKGSFILGARASNWYAKGSDDAVVLVGRATSPASMSDKAGIEQASHIKKGAKVLSAAINPVRNRKKNVGFGVSIAFSDGASFSIVPEIASNEMDGGDDVADWQLFTPYERFLRVGPGPKWSYLPSRRGKDKPANGRTRRTA